MALIAATRSGGRAVSGRIFLLRSVFSPKTLPLPAMRKKASGNGNKRLTEKSEDRKKERLTNEAEF
ncbi:hypothetical protein K0F36_12230 [Bacteroides fragilis]|jgi:hypothetical protein|nr:hypothetical protein [Bacteroides fragilis]